jgi:hypothetical protein
LANGGKRVQVVGRRAMNKNNGIALAMLLRCDQR